MQLFKERKSLRPREWFFSWRAEIHSVSPPISGAMVNSRRPQTSSPFLRRISDDRRSALRCTVLISSGLALTLLFARPSAPQTPNAQAAPAELATQYNQAIKAQDWPGAVVIAQQLVERYPTSANLLLQANAQLNAASAQHDTSKMEASLANYDSAVAIAEQEKPAEGQPETAWKGGVASIYVGKGNALLKLKRMPEALDAYNRSAALSSNPGKAYFNVCAVTYNNGDTTAAVEACRKSVQADPTRADAWFVLASSLFVDGRVDASGKVAITMETRQALQKYIELPPDGPHAADVKAMLDMAAT